MCTTTSAVTHNNTYVILAKVLSPKTHRSTSSTSASGSPMVRLERAHKMRAFGQSSSSTPLLGSAGVSYGTNRCRASVSTPTAPAGMCHGERLRAFPSATFDRARKPKAGGTARSAGRARATSAATCLPARASPRPLDTARGTSRRTPPSRVPAPMANRSFTPPARATQGAALPPRARHRRQRVSRQVVRAPRAAHRRHDPRVREEVQNARRRVCVAPRRRGGARVPTTSTRG